MGQTLNQAGDLKAASGEVAFSDFIAAFKRHKRLVVGLPLVVALLATVLAFLMPNVYQATARLVPPQRSQAGVAAMMSQLAGADGLTAALAASLGSARNPVDLYIGILKSRTLADRLIEQFDLAEAYGTETPEDTRRKLERNTELSIGRDGMIEIRVEDKDKKRSALLANAYYDELVKLADQVAVTETTSRTKFFKQQLEMTQKNLDSAELALKQGAEGDKSKLSRNVKYNEMLYELLAKQYEVARLDEERDPGTIQLLDRAVEPTKSAKPQRVIIVVMSTLFALFAAIGIAFVRELLNRTAR